MGDRGVVRTTRLTTLSCSKHTFHWAAFGGLTCIGTESFVDGDTLAVLGLFSLCYSPLRRWDTINWDGHYFL